MKKVISCKFNIDTACVETKFSDGTILSIYTPEVDATLDITMKQQVEVDWLIYNNPRQYVKLALSGEIEIYAKEMAGFHGMDE